MKARRFPADRRAFRVPHGGTAGAAAGERLSNGVGV